MARRISSKPAPWNSFDQHVAARFQMQRRKLQRQFGQVHGARLIAHGYARHIGCHVATIQGPPAAPPRMQFNRARGSSSRKSPWMNSTPASGSMSSRSSATTRPAGPTRCATTWHQLPGAAPRSTTVMPERSRRSWSIDLHQLERRARALALGLRALHVGVRDVFVHPGLAARLPLHRRNEQTGAEPRSTFPSPTGQRERGTPLAPQHFVHGICARRHGR